MHKFSKPSRVVLDPFAGTHSTASACPLLDKPMSFVECEENVRCLQMSTLSLVGPYASQLLKDKSNFIGVDHLKDSAPVYLAANERGRLRE